MTTLNPELGFYALAGQPKSPRDLIDELQRDPRVLDLSEHIQTAGGAKCRLAEAYREVFGRDLVCQQTV